MRKLNPAFVPAVLFSLFATVSQAQNLNPGCTPNVTHHYYNLIGAPDTIVFTPNEERNGQCCGAEQNNRCISFTLDLDPNTATIEMGVYSGADPSGSLYYRVNCDDDSTQGGTPFCLTPSQVSAGRVYVTSCKPGGNKNIYYIRVVPKPVSPPNVTTRDGCAKTFKILGQSNIQINSFYPGGANTYNYLLSCTTCATPRIRADLFHGLPDTIKYEICGIPLTLHCPDTPPFVCDTVTVIIKDSLTAQITPNPASFCNGGSVTLTGNVSGGLTPYSYIWRNQSNTVVGNNSTYIAGSAQQYSFEVRDTLFRAPGTADACPAALTTVNVTQGINPTVNAGPDLFRCASSPAANVIGSVQNSSTQLWTGGTGTYWPSNASAQISYTPSQTEIDSGWVRLILSSTGGAQSNCTDKSDTVYIYYSPLMTFIGPTHFQTSCNGDSLTLSPAISGGTAPFVYQWSTGASTLTTTLAPGSHCLFVTDSFNCQISRCFSISEPPQLSISLAGFDVSTVGGIDGSATAYPGGGTSPFQLPLE